jgi:hypothetical protein
MNVPNFISADLAFDLLADLLDDSTTMSTVEGAQRVPAWAHLSQLRDQPHY